MVGHILSYDVSFSVIEVWLVMIDVIDTDITSLESLGLLLRSSVMLARLEHNGQDGGTPVLKSF